MHNHANSLTRQAPTTAHSFWKKHGTRIGIITWAGLTTVGWLVGWVFAVVAGSTRIALACIGLCLSANRYACGHTPSNMGHATFLPQNTRMLRLDID